MRHSPMTAARRLMTAALGALALPVHGLAQTGSISQLRACEAKVSARMKQWRLAPISKEVAEYARNSKADPTKVYGDFDGDGRQDIALFIEEGPAPNPGTPERSGSRHVAVCLDVVSGPQLLLIEKLACEDGISLARKGGAYYDFESKKAGTYRLDGIHAYCFEKAGETYEFEKGAFHRIVDSD